MSWLKSFMERHSDKITDIGEDSDADFVAGIFFNILRTAMAKLGIEDRPDCLWNMELISCCTGHKNRTTFAVKTRPNRKAQSNGTSCCYSLDWASVRSVDRLVDRLWNFIDWLIGWLYILMFEFSAGHLSFIGLWQLLSNWLIVLIFDCRYKWSCPCNLCCRCVR